MSTLPNGPLHERLLALVAAAGLSVEKVWLHYFSLGGEAGKVEIDAYLYGLMPLPALQHDILAHAINEHLGVLDRPLAPYSTDGDEPVENAGGRGHDNAGGQAGNGVGEDGRLSEDMHGDRSEDRDGA